MSGRALLLLRMARAMSQAELSDEAGVSRATLSRVEHGVVAMDPTMVTKLTRALGLPSFVFQDACDFVRYLDRLGGEGSPWMGAPTRRDFDRSVWEPELGEPMHKGALGFSLQDSMVADAAGRAVKELVLHVLRTVSSGRHGER